MNCLNDKNEAKSRGLCATCYRQAWRLVKKGVQTWAALEKRGKSSPRALKQGRPQDERSKQLDKLVKLGKNFRIESDERHYVLTNKHDKRLTTRTDGKGCLVVFY